MKAYGCQGDFVVVVVVGESLSAALGTGNGTEVGVVPITPVLANSCFSFYSKPRTVKRTHVWEDTCQ